MNQSKTKEGIRLKDSLERNSDWKKWGTYVGDREWGTVREDYSDNGDPWTYITHDTARSRAYRWSEDAIAGYCNRHQNICLSVAFWNGVDPIIKERYFGLAGPEGNHGEDVKEHYFYIDNTPTHSYAKMLYKYPMNEFPYEQLVQTNKSRSKLEREFELEDTGIFDNDEYFDCFIEYAKEDQETVVCKITVINRSSSREAPITVLPHLWFRNTWSWGYPDSEKPTIERKSPDSNELGAYEKHIGQRYYMVQDDSNQASTKYLFTDNETNSQRLYNWPNATPFVKDGINDSVVKGWNDCVNQTNGTKASAVCHKVLKPGESYTVKVKFSDKPLVDNKTAFENFDKIVSDRKAEADEFYESIHHHSKLLSDDVKSIQRQALSGLIWNKQYYHFGVEMWAKGDPNHPRTTPVKRLQHWNHLYSNDVISMPCKFEFPYVCTWDLGIQMIPMMLLDIEWTKRQLILIQREWFTHSSGQYPAYEWDFSDTNPPVHAWAALEVYKHIEKTTGVKDIEFLEEIFHKSLLNFTWWVNKKDVKGNNLFEGGFLGLDNIGVFDRSSKLPDGARLNQADGTSWMAFYSANMLKIALVLAKERPSYESIATKFLEHYIGIAKSINGKYGGLWNSESGFFFDSVTHDESKKSTPIQLYTFVGLIPLFATEIVDQDTLNALPKFNARLEWFVKYRPNLVSNLASFTVPGQKNTRLLALVSKEKLQHILTKMLNTDWFLSENGLRSLSKHHLEHPYNFGMCDTQPVGYNPGESTTGMFGGNSNWTGPVWIPVNYIMIQSLRTFYEYYGNDLLIEYPTNSGIKLNLDEIADDLSRRLISIFQIDEKTGVRKYTQYHSVYQKPEWRDYLVFNEYFHGDNGSGLGSSHQGWTYLVASLIEELDEKSKVNK